MFIVVIPILVAFQLLLLPVALDICVDPPLHFYYRYLDLVWSDFDQR